MIPTSYEYIRLFPKADSRSQKDTSYVCLYTPLEQRFCTGVNKPRLKGFQEATLIWFMSKYILYGHFKLTLL